ncbi:hypothetical protein Cus16_1054 [Curtobacterium sp. ER1/6]|nr:hypothetical protein Cus16_1054 [Curtobacterium sp. ER1/6]
MVAQDGTARGDRRVRQRQGVLRPVEDGTAAGVHGPHGDVGEGLPLAEQRRDGGGHVHADELRDGRREDHLEPLVTDVPRHLGRTLRHRRRGEALDPESGTALRDDHRRGTVAEDAVRDDLVRVVRGTDVQGAELGTDDEHDGVRVGLGERGRDPERRERRAAPHEADVVPEHPRRQTELLDDVDVGSRLREPGAGHGDEVGDPLGLDAGPLDRVACGGHEEGRREVPVAVVPGAGGRRDERAGVLAEQAARTRRVELVDHRVPVLDRRDVEGRGHDAPAEAAEVGLPDEEVPHRRLVEGGGGDGGPDGADRCGHDPSCHPVAVTSPGTRDGRRGAVRHRASRPLLVAFRLLVALRLLGALQHQLADARGVRLALHGLHDRADDRAGGLHLAVLDLGEHVRLGGEGLVDGCGEGRVVRDDLEPAGLDDLRGRALARDDTLEHLSGQTVGQVARLHERDGLGDVLRRHEVTRGGVLRVRHAADLARPPLARGLRGGAGGDRGLDLVEQAAVDDVLELEVAEAPVPLEATATRDRGLGQGGAELLHDGRVRHHREQVGLREVAVVVGVGLRAPGRGAAGVLVPVPGLLRDRPTRGEDRRLALDLVADRALHGAERVDVLRLGPGAELLLAPRAQGDVRVAAQVAALHARLGHPEGTHEVADDLHVGGPELGRAVLRAEDRLRDDLDERDTGAVVVDERVLRALDAAGGTADVRQLAGVLLHVGALDRHLEDRAVGELDLDLALERDRLVELRDLVVLRVVRVVVVLPGEPRGLGDRAAEGEPELDGVPHGLLVDDRQRSGQTEVDRRHVRVGLAAEEVRGVREHLRLRREFDVDLEAEHRLEALERLVEVHQRVLLRHQITPSCAADC